MKKCILNETKICDDCGECNRCDLDPNKICDNCCKCIDTEADSGFRKVSLADFTKYDEQLDPFLTDQRPDAPYDEEEDGEDDGEDCGEAPDEFMDDELLTPENAALFREWEAKLADLADLAGQADQGCDPALHMHYCSPQGKGKRKNHA